MTNQQSTAYSTSPFVDGEAEMDEETLIQIVELREEFSKKTNEGDCWIKISEEMNLTPELCKQSYTNAVSRYKEMKDDPEQMQMHSKLFQHLRQLPVDLDFDYCLENFSILCRFCLRSDATDIREIFDDSSEDQLSESNELMEKIHFTLYDNILVKVDYKLSNMICDSCSQKIEEFFAFKKQCDRNAQLLMQVKNELDKMQAKAETFDESAEENAGEKEEEEDDEQSTEESSHGDDIEEIDEQTDDESLGLGDSVEKRVKLKKVKNSERSKERNRKSYKGKNSQCQVCGKLVKGIQMHMLTHTGEKRHKCSYCCKSFTQSGQLKRHINSHLNIRNYTCPEPGCARTFVDPSSVTKHLVVHNKEDRKYQCSLCGARFNRLGALRYHEKTHRQERNHSCDICKKSFLAKYDLTKHYRTHTGEKPYSCKYCDKKFSISKNAKVHLRVHTKEKPYSCKFCDLSFAYRSSMKNHLIKIHNHADVSNLPLLQAINIALQTDSDQNELTVNTMEMEMDIAANN